MKIARHQGLLIVIYLVNVCIGLSNSLLGIAWPAMQQAFAAPLSMAGLISLLVTGSAAAMVLLSPRLNRRFSISRIGMAGMVLMTAALGGFAVAPALFLLIPPAVLLGLSIGSMEAQMNHHIAAHYKSRHSSWMQAMWGIGATVGPILMSLQLARNANWRLGYVNAALVAGAIAVVFLLSLPLWHGQSDNDRQAPAAAAHRRVPLRIPGVGLSLSTMLVYCGFEIIIGLWGSSYLVQIHGMAPDSAGRHVSLYFACITVGRILSGFLSIRISNTWLIRISLAITLAGAGLLFLPYSPWTMLAAFSLVGLGLAAIYPCIIYNAPAQFGRDSAQTIIGYQVALGYLGITILPPMLGWIATRLSLDILPAVCLLFTIVLLAATEGLNWVVARSHGRAGGCCAAERK